MSEESISFDDEDDADAELGRWTKSFLDRTFTPEQVDQVDLDGIALGIRTIITMEEKMPLYGDKGVDELAGYTLEEARQRYQKAVRHYRVDESYPIF